MTIASETSRVNLVGNGVNDTFTFTFEIYAKTDLLVYVDNVLQAVDVNYTVPDESIENPDGGDIVFGAEYIPALDAVVSIILNLPYTQLIDYVEADKFPAETHERGLDRLVKIAQQLKERNARQPALLESSQYSDLTLPDPVASKLLAWKDDLSGLKNVEVESEGDLLVTDFIKTLIDDEDATAVLVTLGLTAAAMEFNKGLLRRSQFTWKDVDEIYIGAGVYEVNGKIVYWSSQLTSDIGSPAANDWHYLYLDDSEISVSGSIDATKLVWSNTEPVWNESKHGWYNGNDRCIFAVRTTGTNIKEFFHAGNLVIFADIVTDYGLTDLDTTWTDVTLTIPKFATEAQVGIYSVYVDGSSVCTWRTNDQSGATGHHATYVSVDSTQSRNTIRVITDGSQIIELKHGTSNGNQSGLQTDGWCFPIGM